MIQTPVYKYTADCCIYCFVHALGTYRTVPVFSACIMLLPWIIQYESQYTVVNFMHHACLMLDGDLQTLLTYKHTVTLAASVDHDILCYAYIYPLHLQFAGRTIKQYTASVF